MRLLPSTWFIARSKLEFEFFSIKDALVGNKNGYEVYLVDHSRIQSLYDEIHDPDSNDGNESASKRKCLCTTSLFSK